MSAPRILMGVIGRAHGVRGLVHVTSYATGAGLDSYGALSDAAGRHYRLRLLREGLAEISVEADGAFRPVRDRDQAQALVNTQLFIDRDALPAPDEDEFYLADLVGMAARDIAGQALGQVAVVHDYGAGISLEIAGAGAPLLVPFTRAAVPVVDIAAGLLVIDPPAERVAGRPDSDELSPDDVGEVA